MNFELPTEDQRLAVESFRKFLDAEVRPIAKEYRDRHIPTEKMLEIAQGIAEFGLPGASVPVELGGMGLSFVTEAMLFEELCVVSCDIALSVMINKTMAIFLCELEPSLRD